MIRPRHIIRPRHTIRPRRSLLSLWIATALTVGTFVITATGVSSTHPTTQTGATQLTSAVHNPKTGILLSQDTGTLLGANAGRFFGQGAGTLPSQDAERLLGQDAGTLLGQDANEHIGSPARLDLVALPETGEVGQDLSADIVHVQILGADTGTLRLDNGPYRLRARLYEAVGSRRELATAVSGTPSTSLIGSWDVRTDVRIGDEVLISVPQELIDQLRRWFNDNSKPDSSTDDIKPNPNLVSINTLFPLQIDLLGGDDDGSVSADSADGGSNSINSESVSTDDDTDSANDGSGGTKAAVLHTLRTLIRVERIEHVDREPDQSTNNPGVDCNRPCEPNTNDIVWPGPMLVAVVFDLRLPLSHIFDGSTNFNDDALRDVVNVAEAIAQQRNIEVTVAISPETLDALALAGEESASEALRSATMGNQLLLAEWTNLNINALLAADRADILIDSFQRSAQARLWTEISASKTMLVDSFPTPKTVGLLVGSTFEVTDFVVRTPPQPASAFTTPITSSAGTNPAGTNPAVIHITDDQGGLHRMAVADPFLESLMLENPADTDPELVIHHVIAELHRMASSNIAAGSANAVVYVTPILSTDTVHLLLNHLAASRTLRPVTVDTLISESVPVGQARSGQAATVRADFSQYLADRSATELRLRAYESLIAANADEGTTAPLDTLLAASTAKSITTEDRAAFLAYVNEQISAGISGITISPADRITSTQLAVDIPLTIVNGQPTPVTVALELTSESVSFPAGNQLEVRLEPGRNHLSIPLTASESADIIVMVAVSTPDKASSIILSTAYLKVRFTNLEGLGWSVLVIALVGLAIWKARTAKWRANNNKTTTKP